MGTAVAAVSVADTAVKVQEVIVDVKGIGIPFAGI